MEMEMEMDTERHPVRFLLKFLVVVGILYAASRLLMQQKEEWMGLTESQARAKVESKLSPRVGEDKASEIAEQVVAVLTEKGVIKADPVEEAESQAEDVVEAAADATEEEAE